MRRLSLTPQQRFRLRQQLRGTHDAALFRRTLALLQLDAGRALTDVATELQVSPRSIERWVNRSVSASTPRALLDHRGHAHVTAWGEELQAVLRAALENAPGHYGYGDLDWGVPLLQEHLLRWDGRHWSDTTVRRQLHQLGYVWKRPRYVLLPDPHRTRKMRRIRQRVRELGPRTALLFEDETDLLLFPPLRACWAQRGQPAAVPLSGRKARRVVFGTIHVGTGHRLLLARRYQRGDDFRAFLHVIHEHYRGWQVVLLLDEDSSHTAADSRGLAREYDIELLWLPKRCPELNAMDHLWGHAKDNVCANHQDPEIDHLVEAFIRYIQSLSTEEALRKAGILSDDFWLNDLCDI
jgi:transposase